MAHGTIYKWPLNLASEKPVSLEAHVASSSRIACGPGGASVGCGGNGVSSRCLLFRTVGPQDTSTAREKCV